MDIKKYNDIRQWAEELDGVFTISDLKTALSEKKKDALYRELNNLIENNALIKVKRGIYATPAASLTSISNRIEPGSYISTGTILAKKAIIGSIPSRKIQAVKIGRPRTYACASGIIEHLSIATKLYFGFEIIDGIKYATPEKAFLDVFYFYYKGKRFSFDPYSDINTKDLDFSIINKYLEKYDKRFVSFFNRIWRNQ